MLKIRNVIPIMFLLLTGCLIMLVTGCGNQQEEAREKLGRMNIEYSIESFFQAIENQDNTVCKLFLDTGMAVDVRNNKNETVLMVAAKVGNIDFLQQGLKIKLDLLNEVDDEGYTALWYAILIGQEESISQLDSMGADWGIPNKKGFSILHWALLNRKNEIAKLAIQRGVDVNFKTPDGKAPLQLAQETNNSELTIFLKEQGAIDEVAERKKSERIAAIQLLNGRWFMKGPSTSESAVVVFNENEVVFLPMHGGISKEQYPRHTYSIDKVNLNTETGRGYIVCTFDDGKTSRISFGSNEMMMWDKYPYRWIKESNSVVY